MNFGYSLDEGDSFAVMDAAVDARINSSTPPTSIAAGSPCT
jgi:hypothetical protein